MRQRKQTQRSEKNKGMFTWVSIERNESSLWPLITPRLLRMSADIGALLTVTAGWTGCCWQRKPFHLESRPLLCLSVLWALTAVTSSISASHAQTRLCTSPKSKQQSSNPRLDKQRPGRKRRKNMEKGGLSVMHVHVLTSQTPRKFFSHLTDPICVSAW